MTDRSARLPFDDFLALLRAKGYAVGLHEHLALARLLNRWEGTSGPQFGDALAALVARNDEETGQIRRLYDELYAPPPVPVVTTSTAADAGSWLRANAWMLAAAAAVVLLAVGAWWALRPSPVIPEPPTTQAAQPAAPAVTTPDTPPLVQPEPDPPVLPAPPRLYDRRVIAATGLGLFLVGLAGAWSLKAQEERRAWLRRAWSATVATLPGPFQFAFVLRDPVARLPRIDIEDAATILGRALSNETHATTLDVPRSVRLTVRRGMMPSFVFRPRRVMPTILVVQDTGDDMRVWQDKIELFLTDLRRQGIPLERLYFQGDPRRVTETPRGGAPRDLDVMLRRRPNAPVLVLSVGGSLAALKGTLEAEANDGGPHAIDAAAAFSRQPWLTTLRSRERKTWLTPVSDARLWPAEFDAMPVRVWPMTRRGLVQAARDLAGVDARPPDSVRRRILDEGRVSLDAIERMKRIASLVPYPSTELLELLRRRFAPDVPDAVVLHLLQASGRPTAPVLRMADDEIRHYASLVRFEMPRLERQVRETLLDVLGPSAPPPGSAAHERWQIATAVHRLALADLGSGNRGEAVATLDALGRGPLWEEVRKVSGLTPAVPALHRDAATGALSSSPSTTSTASTAATASTVPATLASQLASAQGEVPGDAPLAGPAGTADSEPMPWVWPGLRELVPATAMTLLLVLVGWLGGAFPVRALPHINDAYRLDYAAGATPQTPELQLQRSTTTPGVPTTVDLYRDSQVYRSAIDLGAGPTSIRLATSDLGRHYQLRATMSGGNLAVSNAVWVPEQSTVVIIDAMPWARVMISENATGQSAARSQGPFTTPFTIGLKPGLYRLQFENNGLTGTLDQTITVDETSRTYRFTMPGFDAAATANQLVPPAPSRGPTAK